MRQTHTQNIMWSIKLINQTNQIAQTQLHLSLSTLRQLLQSFIFTPWDRPVRFVSLGGCLTFSFYSCPSKLSSLETVDQFQTINSVPDIPIKIKHRMCVFHVSWEGHTGSISHRLHPLMAFSLDHTPPQEEQPTEFWMDLLVRMTCVQNHSLVHSLITPYMIETKLFTQ